MNSAGANVYTLGTIAFVAVAVFGSLYPFDFHLVPFTVADKHYHLRLLPPFAPSPDAASPTELRLMTAASVPIGMAAAVWRGRRMGRAGVAARGFVDGALWVLTLTLAQVFVYSRTTDGTLFVAVLPGIALGAAAARLGSQAVTGGPR